MEEENPYSKMSNDEFRKFCEQHSGDRKIKHELAGYPYCHHCEEWSPMHLRKCPHCGEPHLSLVEYAIEKYENKKN